MVDALQVNRRTFRTRGNSSIRMIELPTVRRKWWSHWNITDKSRGEINFASGAKSRGDGKFQRFSVQDVIGKLGKEELIRSLRDFWGIDDRRADRHCLTLHHGFVDIRSAFWSARDGQSFFDRASQFPNQTFLGPFDTMIFRTISIRRDHFFWQGKTFRHEM
jgi:hypothetical protein